MDYDFDVAVIGGGAGGLFAASVANALGAKTAIVEKKRLGGDCTWFGCMPSKALLKTAYVASLFRKLESYSLRTNGLLSTEAALDYVSRVVSEISSHHPNEAFEKRGIKVIIAPPAFLGPQEFEVEGRRIKAKKIILCTGSHPLILPIKGLRELNYLTNETVFSLENMPKSLIVLGGGPIGVELAQSLARLGVEIKVVEMMDRILFREDRDISSFLERKLLEEDIKLLTSKKAVEFGKEKEGVYALLEDKEGKKEKVFAEGVLVAIGRAPNTEGLNLKAAGVNYDKKGIKVNAYLQSSNKNIFACGDVTGPYMFSHIAAYQASVCVRNALFRRIAWQKVNYSNIAWATFTEPEIAHLGLTQEEAREKYRAIKVYKTEYKSSDRAITDNEKEGIVKVITNKKGYILGAHIAGSHASEIIQGLIVAKGLRQPLAKLANLLYIYPTLSELVKKTAAQALVEKANNPLVKFIIKIMKRH